MSFTIETVPPSRRVSSIVFAKRVTTVGSVVETELPVFCCSLLECSSEKLAAAAAAAAEATVGVAHLCGLFRN